MQADPLTLQFIGCHFPYVFDYMGYKKQTRRVVENSLHQTRASRGRVFSLQGQYYDHKDT
jgi:hypothetical protein